MEQLITRRRVVTSGFLAAALAAVLAVDMSVMAQAPQPTADRAQAAARTPAPTTPGGQPDLSGTWERGTIAYGSGPLGKAQPKADGKSICVSGCPGRGVAQGAASGDPNDPFAQAGALLRTPDRPKYKPAFQAKVKDLEARQVFEDPAFRCLSPGVPRIGPPVKIVQTSREVVFLYDDLSGNFFRLIPIDGRPHRTDVEPGYLGDAVGKWEGDTLVVETTNLNTDTWLSDDGSFHTANLRVVERLRRVGDALEWRATAYDPEVLAEPWAMRPRTLTRSTYEIAEAPPCIDRDGSRIVDSTQHHDNPR